MKHSKDANNKSRREKIFLRALQTLTVLAMAALIIIALFVFNVIQIPQFNLQRFLNNTEGTTTPPKIRRAARQSSTNSSYRDLLETGARAAYLGDLSEALASYQRASSLEPREYLPYERMGDILFLQKNYEQAVQNFELASSLNSQNPTLKIKIIKSLLHGRRIIEAKTRLETIQPETQASLYYQGLIAAFLNDQEKAKDMLARSIPLGNDENYKSNAQKILNVYRDFELAREAPIEFLQALLAQSFDQIGEYGLSIELAFAALKKQNDYRDVWIILGHAFLNENKLLDAEDALTKAIQLDSGHPAGYFFRGIAKQKLNHSAEAISDFEVSLRFGWQPRILANLYMADIYFDLKDFEKAFNLYKEVVQADATDINRFIRPIALAINHLNKLQEALSLARLASESHPNTAMGYNLLGWALLANNDLSQALEYLSQARSLDPELDAVYLNLGQLNERGNNFAEALENYGKAIELADKSGNQSIKDTAQMRYNAVVTRMASEQGTSSQQINNIQPSAPAEPLPPATTTVIPQNAPQSEQIIPSLSLL